MDVLEVDDFGRRKGRGSAPLRSTAACTTRHAKASTFADDVEFVHSHIVREEEEIEQEEEEEEADGS